jgi:hypothetical protein
MKKRVVFCSVAIVLLTACGGPKTSADACGDWKKIGLDTKKGLEVIGRYSDKETAEKFDIAAQKAYDIAEYSTEQTKRAFSTAADALGSARDYLQTDKQARRGVAPYFEGVEAVNNLNTFCQLKS